MEKTEKMNEIYTNLFIGDDDDCYTCLLDSGFSIVHACKTCHQEVLKYHGLLPHTHPNYLIYEHGKNLYLNMVDMPNEFLAKYTNPIFKHAMGFIKREIQNKKVLIHCNFGYSRSPSLGFIYLAITGVISKKSINEAMNEFIKLYPKYSPGNGIILYMQHNWDFLMNDLLE